MNDAERIKSKVDIVDVVEEYVTLTPAGSNYKALSPFRQERTPSFMVNPDLQIFKDFGSDQGGDVFTFVMEMEGVEFREALHMLAERAGVSLSQQNSTSTNQQTSSKEHIRTALSYAQKFFQKVLQHEQHGQKARAYLEERGVNADSRERFGIGYAPASFQALRSALAQKSIPSYIAVQSGIEIEKQETGRVYDRFRGRVMFPIQDVMGRVVGFSGRILPEYDDGTTGKYINTPQTAVYDKSSVLFGLYQAKQAIKQADEAILVEGNLDVILSHQADVKNVVAVSGTALTEQHLKILKRYTQTLSFCFDNDPAGISAAKRSVQLAYTYGFVVKAISLTDKDPADIITENPDQWRTRITEKQDFVEYYIRTWQARGVSPDDIMSSSKEQQELAELLGSVDNPLQRDKYVREVARILDVREQSIYSLLQRYVPEHTPRLDRQHSQKTNTHPPKRSLSVRLQEHLVGYAFLNIGLYDIINIDSYLFTDLSLRTLLDVVKSCVRQKQPIRVADIKTQYPDEAQRAEQAILEVEHVRYENPLDDEEESAGVQEMIRHLKRVQKQSALRELRSQLREAQEQNDEDNVQRLMERINQLLQY